MQLKHIDFDKKSFVGIRKVNDGGKIKEIEIEYFIESELSIERAVWKEHFCLVLERGIAVGKQTDDWQKVFELSGQHGKDNEIAVIAHNNLIGFKDLFENRPTILKLCALFINTRDEDRRFIGDITINEKISDWHEGAIAYSSFFLLAINFLSIEAANYKKATADILQQMQAFRNDIEKLMGTPILS